MTDAAARLNHVAWWRGGVASGGAGAAAGGAADWYAGLWTLGETDLISFAGPPDRIPECKFLADVIGATNDKLSATMHACANT